MARFTLHKMNVSRPPHKVQGVRACRGVVGALAALISMATSPVHASALMALDKGCMNCHGTPPRKNTRSFDQLAADYAKYRGQPDAASKLAAKLREGTIFGHIAAHERLTMEDSEKLMQWLVDGAP